MGAGSSAQLPHAQADPSSPQFAVYRRIADKLETEVGKFGTRDLDTEQGKDVRKPSTTRLRRKSVQGREHRLRRIFTSRCCCYCCRCRCRCSCALSLSVVCADTPLALPLPPVPLQLMRTLRAEHASAVQAQFSPSGAAVVVVSLQSSPRRDSMAGEGKDDDVDVDERAGGSLTATGKIVSARQTGGIDDLQLRLGDLKQKLMASPHTRRQRRLSAGEVLFSSVTVDPLEEQARADASFHATPVSSPRRLPRGADGNLMGSQTMPLNLEGGAGGSDEMTSVLRALRAAHAQAEKMELEPA